MKKIFRILLCTVLAVLFAAVAFFIISIILEFKPKERMNVDAYWPEAISGATVSGDFPTMLPDTFRIVTWNIGYAGLGDNMDFFVDGGKRVRDTEGRTRENLRNIISFLKSADADIYLLQEVDVEVHRTYGINETEAIAEAFPGYCAYYAPNFKAWFVPSPLCEPIGQVNSGLVILSRVRPFKVERIQYPSSFPFPVSLFNLKRCLLSAYFLLPDGNDFVVGNTHCTAFDTGGMRSVETDFLKQYLIEICNGGGDFIVGGDWNQYPPQYHPSEAELTNQYFVPEKLDSAGMSRYSCIVCDTSRYSARFNDAPFSENSTRTLLDFFVASHGLQPLSVRVEDLGFRSSDHNPVIATFAVRR